MGDRGGADRGAVAGEDLALGGDLGAALGEAEPDEAHGLGRGAAARAGDAGDGDREVAAERASAPSAIARATASLTAPSASIRAAGTPSIPVLAALE